MAVRVREIQRKVAELAAGDTKESTGSGYRGVRAR
jgi:hypothetical protein